MIDGIAALASMSDKTAAAQHSKVLRHGGLRDGQTLCECRHCGFAPRELFEDGEAGWVGKSLEKHALTFVGHVIRISRSLCVKQVKSEERFHRSHFSVNDLSGRAFKTARFILHLCDSGMG
jgi:hypothetical protein